MLDTLSEREVLPKGPEDETIPTQIHRLDEHSKFLVSQLDALQQQIRETTIDRDALIARAKELNITTDQEFKIIEEPIYPKKSVRVDILKEVAPDKYDRIVANINEKARDKFEASLKKSATFISQADVKAVISDKVLLARVIPEISEPSGFNVVVVKR